jgi:hypothetical protein
MSAWGRDGADERRSGRDRNGAAEPQGRADARSQQYQVERNAREAAAESPDNRQQQQRQAAEPKAGDQKIAIGDLQLTPQEARDLVDAQDSARLSRPQDPNGFRVELPPSFKPPEGLSFAFDQSDPLVAQARAWAHRSGLSQDQFAEGLALFAGAKISDLQTITNARMPRSRS